MYSKENLDFSLNLLTGEAENLGQLMYRGLLKVSGNRSSRYDKFYHKQTILQSIINSNKAFKENPNNVANNNPHDPINDEFFI